MQPQPPMWSRIQFGKGAEDEENNVQRQVRLNGCRAARRKTMTRRIIRNLSDFDPRQDWINWGNNDNEKASIAIFHIMTYKCTIYPQYQPGEVVAVAQRYRDLSSDSRSYKKMKLLCHGEMPWNVLKGWDNKMFVKSDLMPHRIRITDIKVERLQGISDEDCIEEGINQVDMGFSYRCPRGICAFSSPKDAFASLIDGISGKGTWALNPFVFVYTFVLVD